MDKGILVILAIGAAFIYFAMNMFQASSEGDDPKWSSPSRHEAPYTKYYKEDVLGDKVLDLSGVTLKQAKAIWPGTPTQQQIAEKLPDFALAKAETRNALKESDFKRYLLKYLDDLEGRYLGGEVDVDQARAALKTLK